MGKIAACWYGNRNERPILASHGWQDNAGTFALLAPVLSKHVAILAIDLPGHGRSSHYPVGCIYHTLDYVSAIGEIMLYFRWPKISLIAHSMSSAVIFHFTSLFPEAVDMIISIDVVHTRYFTLDQQIGILNLCIEKLLIDTERKLKSDVESRKPPSYTLAELENMLHEGSEESVDLDKAKYILERSIKAAEKLPNKYYLSRDSGIKCVIESYTEPGLTVAMAARMHNIKWMILKAENSEHINENNPTTKKVLEILKANNPDFFYYFIPGAKHHCHLNNMEKLAEYIVPFLRKYRPAEYFNYENSSKL